MLDALECIIRCRYDMLRTCSIRRIPDHQLDRHRRSDVRFIQVECAADEVLNIDVDVSVCYACQSGCRQQVQFLFRCHCIRKHERHAVVIAVSAVCSVQTYGVLRNCFVERYAVVCIPVIIVCFLRCCRFNCGELVFRLQCVKRSDFVAVKIYYRQVCINRCDLCYGRFRQRRDSSYQLRFVTEEIVICCYNNSVFGCLIRRPHNELNCHDLSLIQIIVGQVKCSAFEQLNIIKTFFICKFCI